MAFTEDDMRQTINLATALSAENRRLKRVLASERESLRCAVRLALDAVDVIDGCDDCVSKEDEESDDMRRRLGNLIKMSKMAPSLRVKVLLERCAKRSTS